MDRDAAIQRAAQIPGWMTEEELGWLYDVAARVPRGQAIVELGTYKGRSVTALALGAQAGNRAPVYTVDACDPEVGDINALTGERVFGNFNIAFQNLADVAGFIRSRTEETAWYDSHPHLPVGLLFIDGGHEYEQVRADLTAWMPRMVNGGIVACHDYGYWPGVTEAVDEVAGAFEPIDSVGTIWAGRLQASELSFGKAPPVYWAMLLERAVLYPGVRAAIHLAVDAAKHGYSVVTTPYARTDESRNGLVDLFLRMTSRRDAILVMLDCDHNHPADIVHRLVSADWGDYGVLFAKMRRRSDDGTMPDWTAWRRVDGSPVQMTDEDWPESGIVPVALAATGAVAIRRWVFGELDKSGAHFPYFRYQYQDRSTLMPTEDIDFCARCEQSGVKMGVVANLYTPHLSMLSV